MRIHFGLRHGDEEQHMAAQQLHRTVDDFGAHGGFGQVGDPENQRAARLQAADGGRSAQVVGLAGFGAHLCQQTRYLAQMSRAASG